MAQSGIPTEIPPFKRHKFAGEERSSTGDSDTYPPRLDITHKVEHVKQERKLCYLFKGIQEATPPVLVFVKSSESAIAIQDYLLHKGIRAVAVHGEEGPQQRHRIYGKFTLLKKEVLVATDLASRYPQFPGAHDIVHYDMPFDVKDYEHRMTCFRESGRATALVNKDCDESVLLYLKSLLYEANQDVPPCLSELTERCFCCCELGHSLTGSRIARK